ncbi:substrate-binding domain-containing protein [Phytoactinopolyspora mesophila]|uniref:Substrate-binding domain-containing protein n=1 Tax=Phytoactinopolyspora mesophila TaxID=2650750 RepID=A0A7K3M0Y4_9ACTN|nr:substrate-binding domain-containing protein [Phytoactinopolyspora mesophila]NDL56934.1 substrate-binding domain-containing protein [Phytoactinopolyspora mesophila]
MRRPLIAVVATLTLAVAACGNDDGNGNDGDAAAGDVTIGLSISTLENPFFVTLRDGAEAVAEDAGIELRVSDARDDAQSQANHVQDFITRSVDVLVVNPVDTAAIVPSIEAANDAGIPVVTVDRGSDGGEIAAHVASDNVLGGRLAGEFLFEQIGDSGEVAQLEGIAGTSAARDRGAGFQEALDAASGIDLVGSQAANFSRDEGLTVAENVLQANSGLAGVFAQNDEMALGAVEAARSAGLLDDLVIVGFDATDDALAAIDSGEMDATVAQLPSDMGGAAIEAAIAIANGDDVDAEQSVEVQLVTADNVGDFLE